MASVDKIIPTPTLSPDLSATDSTNVAPLQSKLVTDMKMTSKKHVLTPEVSPLLIPNAADPKAALVHDMDSAVELASSASEDSVGLSRTDSSSSLASLSSAFSSDSSASDSNAPFVPTGHDSHPFIAELRAAMGTKFAKRSREVVTMTKAQVKERVLATGDQLIIFDGNVYDLTKWVKYHPGGQLAISHMAGKDATDAMIAMHPKEVITKRLPNFFMAKLAVDPQDPSSAPLSQSLTSVAYRELDAKLHNEGFYQTNYWFYVREFIKFGFLITMTVGLVVYGSRLSTTAAPSSEQFQQDQQNQFNINNNNMHSTSFSVSISQWLIFLVAAFCNAALWHQGAFVAHDAGHSGVSHKWGIDFFLGIFLGNFVGGLSIGWWKKSHNVHHIITNSPEHDPDIQHMPFIAITTRFFDSIYSTFHKRILKFDLASRFFISIQHRLFYIVLSFGRFNLYIQSLIYLLTDTFVPFRGLELTGMVFFACWYTALVSMIPTIPMRIMYVYVSHALTMLLHIQITLSHFAMSTEVGADPKNFVEQIPAERLEKMRVVAEENEKKEREHDIWTEESFAEMALRTTMDIECPTWLDWLHGGLQFQLIHHLFPRLPRHNLRKVIPFIHSYSEFTGIPYITIPFVAGNMKVLDQLKDVASQVEKAAAGPNKKRD